jgi:hypothetical protein
MIHFRNLHTSPSASDWYSWRCDLVDCPECRELEAYRAALDYQTKPEYEKELARPARECLFRPLPDEVSVEGASITADWKLEVGSSSGYDGGTADLRILLGILASTDDGRKMIYEVLGWSLDHAEVANRRIAQVEEISRLVSRPHCKFGPDDVVGAVKSLLSNLRHGSEGFS